MSETPEKRPSTPEIDKATVDKLKAETEEIRQRMIFEKKVKTIEFEKAQAEIQKLRAEAAKVEYEAQYTQHQAEAARISRDDLLRAEQDKLASNRFHHVYTFGGAVNESSVKTCINMLDIWDRQEPGCAVTIIFDSPGGSVIDGMALFDYITQFRSRGHHVTTMMLGYAASMAGILLQAGDKRVSGRESYLLIHEISTAVMGKIGEIEDEVEFVKKIQGRVLDIFAKRSHMTKTQIARRWKRKDWWLDSEEALKLGFIDEIQ